MDVQLALQLAQQLAAKVAVQRADRHVGRSRLVDHALKHLSSTEETFLRCTMRREAQRIYQKSDFEVRAENCFLPWLAYALRDVRSHCKAPTQGLVHGRRSGRVVLRRPIRCEDQKAPAGCAARSAARSAARCAAVLQCSQ